MSDMDEDLWDAQRLARYLGLATATVVCKASQKPHELPPRAPGHKQRWVPEVVRAWVMPAKARGGRPRMPT
jgi:hypothetical protein